MNKVFYINDDAKTAKPLYKTTIIAQLKEGMDILFKVDVDLEFFIKSIGNNNFIYILTLDGEKLAIPVERIHTLREVDEK